MQKKTKKQMMGNYSAEKKQTDLYKSICLQSVYFFDTKEVSGYLLPFMFSA